jgi:DNA-binding transcriptional MerR regulator
MVDVTSGRLTPPDEAPGDPRLLTIGQLSERTGVSSANLRSWEQRWGFPVPVRTPGGQRRYRAAEVERVQRVVEERRRGLTLGAAVRATTREDQVGAQSLYAELRATHPHLEPVRVGVRTMKALTWSVEDECLAHASRPVLLGCFQTQQSFRRAGRRWRELARSATAAVAFSDFEASDATTAPVQVALPSTSPMLNEWSLVCLDPQLSVVLVAWEPPPTGQTGGARRFEGLISFEPEVVRDAALRYGSICSELGLPALEERVAAGTDGLAEDPRRTASLLRRFSTYADA